MKIARSVYNLGMILILSGIALVSSIGQAQELQWTHYGVRPQAMGNAFVSVVDDYNTLYYNPAGLARIKKWDGELINPTMVIAQNTTSLISDIVALAQGDGGGTSGVLDLFKAQAGKAQFIGLQLSPHLIFPNFGFGVSAQFNNQMAFTRFPSVGIDAGMKLIMPFSFAFNALENRLSYGFTVKGLFQTGIVHEFSLQDLEYLGGSEGGEANQASLDDFIQGGPAVGVDTGILFTPIQTMKPTLGISITDFGGTVYQEFKIGGQVAAKPATRLPSLNVGFSMRPYEKTSQYLLVAVDMHAVNQPINFSKKLNLGAEYGLGTIFKAQAGLHQGYLTAGLQLDVGLLNLKLATFAEELSAVAGGIADRRYAVQFKLLL
jgi:hypothetical protein